MIRSAGYDEQQQILELEYTSRQIYRYLDVPPHIYEELMNAPSIGTYVNECIKDCYAFIQLN